MWHYKYEPTCPPQLSPLPFYKDDFGINHEGWYAIKQRNQTIKGDSEY